MTPQNISEIKEPYLRKPIIALIIPIAYTLIVIEYLIVTFCELVYNLFPVKLKSQFEAMNEVVKSSWRGL